MLIHLLMSCFLLNYKCSEGGRLECWCQCSISEPFTRRAIHPSKHLVTSVHEWVCDSLYCPRKQQGCLRHVSHADDTVRLGVYSFLSQKVVWKASTAAPIPSHLEPRLCEFQRNRTLAQKLPWAGYRKGCFYGYETEPQLGDICSLKPAKSTSSFIQLYSKDWQPLCVPEEPSLGCDR